LNWKILYNPHHPDKSFARFRVPKVMKKNILFQNVGSRIKKLTGIISQETILFISTAVKMFISYRLYSSYTKENELLFMHCTSTKNNY
jgi:hypothetical protein